MNQRKVLDGGVVPWGFYKLYDIGSCGLRVGTV